MTPGLTDRLAKLLHLACSTGPDGEKLAALNRLSATAAAHDLDWNRVLANSGGPALTEEQMRRIYDEGYHRGHADGQQTARPERDWTPSGGSAEVGPDSERLRIILEAARQSAEAGLLSEWEEAFSTDMLERFKKYGNRMYVSEKQWASLDRLEANLRRQNFID
jgi:hypothetical protein